MERGGFRERGGRPLRTSGRGQVCKICHRYLRVFRTHSVPVAKSAVLELRAYCLSGGYRVGEEVRPKLGTFPQFPGTILWKKAHGVDEKVLSLAMPST